MPQKYISPWPAADAMRRRAMSTGRNTWKQPEPAATPKQRIIADFVVDNDTYRKYDRMTWDLGDGVSRSIYGVRIYATSADIAENYPELAARAKELYAQIGKEIYSKNDGKEDEAMSNPKTASDFLRELQTIYTETRSRYTTLNESVVKAEKQLERAQEKARGGDSIAQARLEVARADLREAQDACRTEYGKMMNDYNARVKELRGQFADHLNKHYAASPDKLDTATMQLLGSGICTPVELARLVDRHQGNPTMLRIVGEYARKLREDNKRNMSHDNQVICSNVANAGFSAKDGGRELAIFDSAVSAANYGLGKDYDHATRMHSHVGGWFEDFKQSMNNLPVVPEEMAPDNSKEE